MEQLAWEPSQRGRCVTRVCNLICIEMGLIWVVLPRKASVNLESGVVVYNQNYHIVIS